MQTAIYGDLEDQIRGRAAGADDYVAKPIDSHELLSRVSTMLRVRNVYRMLRDSESALQGKVNELEGAYLKLKETQAELVHTEKLSVMGRMSSEIIHVSGRQGASMVSQIKSMEREAIVHALKENEWNQLRTAEALDMNHSTLQYKMKKYGIKMQRRRRARAT